MAKQRTDGPTEKEVGMGVSDKPTTLCKAFWHLPPNQSAG